MAEQNPPEDPNQKASEAMMIEAQAKLLEAQNKQVSSERTYQLDVMKLANTTAREPG